MVMDRVHNGNYFKSANKSFNQVLFVSEATGNILDALIDNSTYYLGYRCSAWFCSPCTVVW